MNDALQQFGVGLRFGIIEAISANPPRYKVKLDDADGMVTDWLLALTGRSKGDRDHHGLEVGEQVSLLLDNSGEQGVILGAVYSEADPAPAGTWVKSFSDGTTLSYEKESKLLTVDCKGETKVTSTGVTTVTAQAIVLDAPLTTIKQDLVVVGRLSFQNGIYGQDGLGGASSINCTINWAGDLILNDISLKDHKHQIPGGSTGNMTP